MNMDWGWGVENVGNGGLRMGGETSPRLAKSARHAHPASNRSQKNGNFISLPGNGMRIHRRKVDSRYRGTSDCRDQRPGHVADPAVDFAEDRITRPAPEGLRHDADLIIRLKNPSDLAEADARRKKGKPGSLVLKEVLRL
jgi:hypothetical protein